MKHRRLGRAGFEVSSIGHGLWGMGSWSDSDDARSAGALDLAVRLGCNFFDSAQAYGNGRGDRLLGDLLRRHGEKRLFAASKVPPRNMRWPASAEDRLDDTFPMEYVLRSADQILKNLRSDRIDLLQFHVWSDAWAADERWMRTVRKMKEEGMIASFGLSVNRWEPANCVAALRSGMVDVVQMIYNIFDQAPEDELFPECQARDIGVIARVPLDEGSLGGKLTRTTTFPENDWRSRYFSPENLRLTMDRIEKLQPLVPRGTTLPDMALRFILANPVVSTAIVGMRKPEHVAANLAVSDAPPLEAALLEELRKHRWDRTPAEWSR